MSARPRLSLCVPTCNRSSYIESVLLAGLQRASRQPPGTVEVLVCDNASTDGTPGLLARIQSQHPELRVFLNSENLGFDGNYLRCVQEARGEFVWVMGDDDDWKPDAVERMLQELDLGADACLCLSQACDLEMKEVTVLKWYLDPDPPTEWRLEGRGDLIRYFDSCAYNAAAFAFICVAVFRRDRFLAALESVRWASGDSYVHLWGMMAFFRQPLVLRYIPEVLVRNRISDLHPTSSAFGNLYGRWMQDLKAWARVADGVFGDDPELHGAFSRILGRNHHNTILPGLRRHAPDDAAWREAGPYLVRAGFSPVRIAAADFAYQHLEGGRLPMPGLDPSGLCLADLALVARGALRIAVLALGGVEGLLAGAGLLAALRSQRGASRIRVLCPAGAAALLDGFEVVPVDPARYARDLPYREAVAGDLAGFAPELAVNLDPERGVEADDLVNAALPAGAIAFELPPRGQDARMVKAANGAYHRLVPKGDWAGMAGALGLELRGPALWPAPAARQEARELLAQLGWEPRRTLAVLGDDPSRFAEPGFMAALDAADARGWTFLGVGDRGAYRALEALLGSREGRAANLAGVLGLEATAALLQGCGGFLGGGPLLRSLAAACNLGLVGAAED